ncbi:MAG: MMPL family transporter [Planctomycetaceae bacterium]|nr:MMPL family transporter [Planctomycetaceae bacterium]
MSESPATADTAPTSRWTVRRALIVLGIMALAIPFVVIELGKLSLENDVATWLPADDPHSQVLSWFHARFGDHSGLLVSWDGSSLNDPRVEKFAAALAGPPDDVGKRTQLRTGILEVLSPHDLVRRMLASDVDRDTAVDQLQGVVIGTGLLKVRLTSTGKPMQDQIVERIRQRAMNELGITLTFRSPIAEQQSGTEVAHEEPQEETFRANEFSGPEADDPYPLPPPHDFQIEWAGMTPGSPNTRKIKEICGETNQPNEQQLIEDVFFAPGNPVAVIVTLDQEGEEKVQETLTMIRDAAAAAGVPESSLHMGGSPVGRGELDREAEAASWNPDVPWWNFPKRSPVLLSGIVGIGLSFIVLQSFRLAILVLIADLYVAAVAVALLPATGHPMNMVLIVMPNLLIVLTASGAVHIANYWKHAAAKNLDGAVSSAVKMGWQPCLLASVTTAIGLSSLTTSVLRPVKEFGIFSAIGCVLSLVVVLFGFPSMLRLWKGSAPPPEDADRSVWRWLGHWLHERGTAVTIYGMLAMAVGLYGLKWFRTETKVIRYFQPDSRIVQDYEFLERNLAGIAPVDVVIAFDEQAQEDLTSVERMELVRTIKEQVAAYPEISGTLALSDFRSPMQPPPDDAPLLVKARYNKTDSELKKFIERAQSDGENELLAVNPAELSVQFEDHRVELPAGAELWRIRAQVALMTDLDYSVMTDDLNELVTKSLRDVPGTSHVVTGTIPLFLRTQNAVVESLVKSFGLAFTVIAIVIMILLRHPIAGLITMLPNLMPVIVVFGLISAAGVPVDIGTMITASVALGIAVDGTLHLLTWFRDGLQQGMSRRDAIALGLAHCGPAMWQTSAAIGLGLSMLAFADLLLISRFGWLMGALIGAALAADILFLPGLLAGPLGTMIEKRIPRQIVESVPSDERTHSHADVPVSASRAEVQKKGEHIKLPEPARSDS